MDLACLPDWCQTFCFLLSRRVFSVHIHSIWIKPKQVNASKVVNWSWTNARPFTMSQETFIVPQAIYYHTCHTLSNFTSSSTKDINLNKSTSLTLQPDNHQEISWSIYRERSMTPLLLKIGWGKLNSLRLFHRHLPHTRLITYREAML